jgi:hypothetical protein
MFGLESGTLGEINDGAQVFANCSNSGVNELFVIAFDQGL